MNRWILQDRNASIVKRLPYFKSILLLLAVACFALGYRAIYNRHLESLDSHFRKFCRSIVKRIANSHAAKDSINRIFRCAYSLTKPTSNHGPVFVVWAFGGSQTYSHTTARSWVRRILRWCPTGTYRIGRPLGIETSSILQVQRLGTMDWRCYESHLGSTLRIFHRILLHVG